MRLILWRDASLDELIYAYVSKACERAGDDPTSLSDGTETAEDDSFAFQVLL